MPGTWYLVLLYRGVWVGKVSAVHAYQVPERGYQYSTGSPDVTVGTSSTVIRYERRISGRMNAARTLFFIGMFCR